MQPCARSTALSTGPRPTAAAVPARHDRLLRHLRTPQRRSHTERLGPIRTCRRYSNPLLQLRPACRRSTTIGRAWPTTSRTARASQMCPIQHTRVPLRLPTRSALHFTQTRKPLSLPGRGRHRARARPVVPPAPLDRPPPTAAAREPARADLACRVASATSCGRSGPPMPRKRVRARRPK